MLLRTARRSYAAAIRAELTAAGFDDVPTNGQHVIRSVAHGGTPADIARDLAVSKQAASQLIELLVQRGYLERTNATFDRRRIALRLSTRGKRANRIINAGTEHVNDRLAEELSPKQVAGFLAALKVLSEMVDDLEPGERTA